MNTALEALARELSPFLTKERAQQGIGYKHDASGTPATGVYTHGPGGVLTFPGVDPTLFHTIVGARGLIGRVPSMPSVYMNPLYAIITGVKADTGSEKNNVCDDAPIAGLMKSGMVTSVFGRYERATPELEINRLGQRNDRADPLDLSLIGSPLQDAGLFSQGLSNTGTPRDLLTNEIARKFWERNVSMHRLLSRQFWRGNPANNSAGGGSKQMTGMSLLVNTGYKDAETGTSLPSVDSLIVDFGSKRIDGTGNGTAMVEIAAYVFNFLENLAFDTGVDPVRWVIAMRKMAFFELTKIWPCSYLTTNCNVSSPNTTQFVDATEQIKMRDDMRNGSYLMVNGNRYEVVLDDGIAFDTNTTSSAVASGCERSDIYIIPMSVVGGQAVTYLEYFDYSNPSIDSALEGSNMILGRVEGAFITVPKQKNFCVQWQSKIEPRLVMRTPWLAARIKNVVYCPAIQPRTAFPDDPYFVDGGLTERSGPSYYRVWA